MGTSLSKFSTLFLPSFGIGMTLFWIVIFLLCFVRLSFDGDPNGLSVPMVSMDILVISGTQMIRATEFGSHSQVLAQQQLQYKVLVSKSQTTPAM